MDVSKGISLLKSPEVKENSNKLIIFKPRMVKEQLNV